MVPSSLMLVVFGWEGLAENQFCCFVFGIF